MSMRYGASASIRALLLSGAACLSASLVLTSIASADDKVEKVTVTGSRIKKPNLTSPSQIVTVTAQKIELSGEANTADVLRTLPSTGVSALSTTNSNFLTTGNGVNTVDLRNLGENRTLVLVNGRRFVSGISGANIVDFNTIPTSMIERIDVVTGGSSSVYGSDAVAGVINIRLKNNFEGIVADVQRGENTVFTENYSDKESLTVGGNFADGKGNAAVNITYQDAGPAFARTRDPIDCAALSLHDCGDANTGVVGRPFFSSFFEGGRFRFSNTAGAASVNRALNPDGTIRTTDTNGLAGPADGFNRQAFRLDAVGDQRYQFTGLSHFDISDSHRVFAEAFYTQTHASSDLEPFPLDSANIYGTGANNTEQVGAILHQPFGVPVTNPTIPLSMLQLLGTRFGVAPAIVAGPRAGLVAALAAIPGANIGFARRMTELGGRGNEFDSSTARVALGAEGKIGTWDYEGSYVWGETKQSQVGGGQVNTANMRQSLDSIDDGFGNIICRDPVARSQGCVAVNIFLPPHVVGSPTNGNWTEAAQQWLRAPVFRNQVTRQEVLEGSVTGTIFDLPAGPLEGAFGGEYRKEFSSDVPDALTQTGQNASNKTAPTIGSFDVYEVFGEFHVPLLSDKHFFKDLSLDLSGRQSDYSTTGANFSWTVSGEWTPVAGLRFRGQDARAVRAPNVGELFGGPGENFAAVIDVCNNIRTAAGVAAAGLPPGTLLTNAAGTVVIEQTNAQIRANCLSNAGILARANTAGGFQLTQPERQGTGGFGSGNPNLSAETSDSYTFGVVLSPDLWKKWIGDLTVSVDYYNFDITDAIASVSRNNTISFCYQTPGLASPLCAGVVRDINGAITQVNTANGNFNTLATDGIDVDASYDFELASLAGGPNDDFGRLQLTVLYTHLNGYTTTVLPGTAFETVDDTGGGVGFATNRYQVGAVYTMGNLLLSWTGRFTGKSFEDDSEEFIDGVWFHDAQVRYDVTSNIAGYIGVRNLTDEYVRVAGTNGDLGQPTGWSTFPDTYDGLGRRWYAGVNVHF